MRRASPLLTALLAVIAVGCGGGDDDSGGQQAGGATATTQQSGSHTLQLTGKRSTLSFGEGLQGKLQQGNVRVRAVGRASGSDGTFRLPITGGRLSPEGPSGTVRHGGGLQFRSQGKTLTLRNFVVDFSKGVVTAQIGNERVPALQLDTDNVQRSRQGDTVVLKNIGVSLTKQAAKRIENRFNIDPPLFIDPVEKGTPVGTLTIRATGR